MEIKDAAGLAAVAISIITAVVVLSRTYGFDRGAELERRKSVDAVLKRHEGSHKDHYQHAKDDQVHFADTELHWTGRERDSLMKHIERLDAGIQELLTRSGQRRKDDHG